MGLFSWKKVSRRASRWSRALGGEPLEPRCLLSTTPALAAAEAVSPPTAPNAIDQLAEPVIHTPDLVDFPPTRDDAATSPSEPVGPGDNAAPSSAPDDAASDHADQLAEPVISSPDVADPSPGGDPAASPSEPVPGDNATPPAAPDDAAQDGEEPVLRPPDLMDYQVGKDQVASPSQPIVSGDNAVSSTMPDDVAADSAEAAAEPPVTMTASPQATEEPASLPSSPVVDAESPSTTAKAGDAARPASADPPAVTVGAGKTDGAETSAEVESDVATTVIYRALGLAEQANGDRSASEAGGGPAAISASASPSPERKSPAGPGIGGSGLGLPDAAAPVPGTQVAAARDHVFAAGGDDNGLPSGVLEGAMEVLDMTAGIVNPDGKVTVRTGSKAAIYTWRGMRHSWPIVAGLMGEAANAVAREAASSNAAAMLLQGAAGAALTVGMAASDPRAADAAAPGSGNGSGTRRTCKVAGHDVPGDDASSEGIEGLLSLVQYPTDDEVDDALNDQAMPWPLGDDRDRPEIVLYDVIGRLEAELATIRDQLARQTRLAAVGQVAASIAHDLRNPLAVVRNVASVLKLYLPAGDAETQGYLQLIDAQVEGASRIISNLMESVRAKQATKQLVDLGAAAAEVFAALANRDEVRWRFDGQPAPFMVHADPVQLRQVLGNLMGNAAEAMRGRGEISVEACQEGPFDIIVVRDTGPGIPPQIRDTLFEPLVSTREKGTGLGLAICRQIIERHGGTIDLMPAESAGAAFLIRLPRAV